MNAWSVDEVLNCIDCSIYCQTPDLDVFLSIITDICLTPLPLSGATEWWVGAAFLHNSDCHGFMGSIGQVRYLWRNDCCSWKSRSNSKEAVTRNKECDVEVVQFDAAVKYARYIHNNTRIKNTYSPTAKLFGGLLLSNVVI